ncbi:MAG: hypothetical protein AB1540_11185 [Bdellovibrionota bacterium]
MQVLFLSSLILVLSGQAFGQTGPIATAGVSGTPKYSSVVVSASCASASETVGAPANTPFSPDVYCQSNLASFPLSMAPTCGLKVTLQQDFVLERNGVFMKVNVRPSGLGPQNLVYNKKKFVVWSLCSP